MPSHIRTKVYAAPEVLAALLNSKGQVDLSMVIPHPPGLADLGGDGISMAAEGVAKNACAIAPHSNPMIASLEMHNRSRDSATKLPPADLEQAITMIRNYCATGYLHGMDFQSDKWGTKWNAYSQQAGDAGCLIFETAWSAPLPVIAELSAQHRGQRIEVVYADEDIGANCGTVVYLNGECVEKNVAPRWSDSDEDTRRRWREFALAVWGRTDDDEDEDEG